MAQNSSSRLVSVDFLRGITVAFMIIANNPGDTMYVYSELVHAKWHGWTAVDFIFPLFLFLVGVSVALSVRRGKASQNAHAFWLHAFKRAAVLFGLGLIVNGFPFFDLDSLRIPGVLQRIAAVYLATLWLHVSLGKKGVAGVIAAILGGYWLLWTFVPVPGLGRPSLDFEYNLEGWLDQMLLRGHIWEYDTTWDPEGLLSTFPCIALSLIGVLAGRWLKDRRNADAWAVFLLGLTMHLGGLAWNRWFPINKLITTSSFVLFVGGVGLMLLSLLHVLLDTTARRAWMDPFLALGKNALFIFVVSQIATKVLFVTKLPWGLSQGKSLHFWLYGALFGWWGNGYVASVAWAVAILAVLTAVVMVMDRKKIYIRM